MDNNINGQNVPENANGANPSNSMNPGNMPNNQTRLRGKNCKYCKCEIPFDAKVCPNCRKRQGIGVGKIILIVVAVLLVIGIIGAAGSSKTKVDNSNSGNSNSTNTATNAAGNEMVNVGGSFTTKKGLKCTIDSYLSEYTEYSIYQQPGDGMKYIKVSFTYENTGSSDAYTSAYDFKCYADNASCEQKLLTTDLDINNNISSGRTASYNAFFEVPVNAGSIELEYDSLVSTDKVTVKLQ